MINLELLTSETEKLVKNKKGYRYENLYFSIVSNTS